MSDQLSTADPLLAPPPLLPRLALRVGLVAAVALLALLPLSIDHAASARGRLERKDGPPLFRGIIPEAEIVGVAPGLSARVRFDVYPDSGFITGHVIAVAPDAAGFFAVDVALDRARTTSGEPLIEGLSGQAVIATGRTSVVSRLFGGR